MGGGGIAPAAWCVQLGPDRAAPDVLCPFGCRSHQPADPPRLPVPPVQGALVIRHELSFAHRMSALEDKWLQNNLAMQLTASYARLDVPAVMKQVG